MLAAPARRRGWAPRPVQNGRFSGVFVKTDSTLDTPARFDRGSRMSARIGGDLNRVPALHDARVMREPVAREGAPSMMRTCLSAAALASLGTLAACGGNPKPQTAATPAP